MLTLLQIEEMYCSSLYLAQLQETFFEGYCYQLIMSYFLIALIWSLIALTTLTGILWNMYIQLLHLQLKVMLIKTLNLYQ